jgi:hypothetical protein
VLLVSGSVRHSQRQQPAPDGGARPPEGGARATGDLAQGTAPTSGSLPAACHNATEVLVNGDAAGGCGISMTSDGTGVWSVTTEPPGPRSGRTPFSAYGVTVLDPGNYHAMRDGWRHLSPILISGEPSALYQNGKVPHGTIPLCGIRRLVESGAAPPRLRSARFQGDHHPGTRSCTSSTAAAPGRGEADDFVLRNGFGHGPAVLGASPHTLGGPGAGAIRVETAKKRTRTSSRKMVPAAGCPSRRRWSARAVTGA